ncbi:MAG: O-acetylhomoserine aminocarboxypropyltransferase/cysteine synthase family protein [Spirochaetia bacterium]
MNRRFETEAVHGGHIPDTQTRSRAVPLYRTTSYLFRDTSHAADLFALKEEGNIYTRLGNPTQEVLEHRMAALEGGKTALALASGTSAIFYTVINMCSAGDEIVSASNLYGGTFTMFHSILPQFGITVRFVSINDPDSVASAINERTRCIFCESIGNPNLEVTDLDPLSETARSMGVPLVVDSTFTTPYLLRPLEYGADVVVHSLTKWLGGHGTAIGGIVVDGGKFDWSAGRHPLFTEPDASYHGLRWARDLGDKNDIAFLLRMRTVPLRNLGACISPDNAWIFLQGLETLALRMERHSENALKTARFLEAHPRVSWVRYPGLPQDPSFSVGRRYLNRGAGGMVVFGIEGGAEAGKKFVEKLALFSHLANVGDAKSLAVHPASTTHAQLTKDQQRAAGIDPGLIRLSIGIEHIDDILDDLQNAL